MRTVTSPKSNYKAKDPFKKVFSSFAWNIHLYNVEHFANSTRTLKVLMFFFHTKKDVFSLLLWYYAGESTHIRIHYTGTKRTDDNFSFPY